MDTHHAPVSVEELTHSFEEPPPEVDLSIYRFEDWVAFVMFWGLCAIVFYQFFTRYALNSSAAWTEEIARYFLVAVVFVGSAMCVRMNHHIQVDFLYRYLSPGVARVLATLVDVLRVGFLGYAVWLTWEVMDRVGYQQMTMVELPMSIVYGFVLAGFIFMFFRAAALAVTHWRTRSSTLEHPPTFDDEVK
jgi:TRAP-type C4-dicarboxylate transport system permease small subunit